MSWHLAESIDQLLLFFSRMFQHTLLISFNQNLSYTCCKVCGIRGSNENCMSIKSTVKFLQQQVMSNIFTTVLLSHVADAQLFPSSLTCAKMFHLRSKGHMIGKVITSFLSLRCKMLSASNIRRSIKCGMTRGHISGQSVRPKHALRTTQRSTT